MDWDEEAQAHAYREAQRLQTRDPDAAALLMAQLVVTQEYQRQRAAESGSLSAAWQESAQLAVYRPVELYAYLAEKTGWTHHYMDRELHYLDFFAYLAEFLERDRRQNEAFDNASRGHAAFPAGMVVDGATGL